MNRFSRPRMSVLFPVMVIFVGAFASGCGSETSTWSGANSGYTSSANSAAVVAESDNSELNQE